MNTRTRTVEIRSFVDEETGLGLTLCVSPFTTAEWKHLAAMKPNGRSRPVHQMLSVFGLARPDASMVAIGLADLRPILVLLLDSLYMKQSGIGTTTEELYRQLSHASPLLRPQLIGRWTKVEGPPLHLANEVYESQCVPWSTSPPLTVQSLVQLAAAGSILYVGIYIAANNDLNVVLAVSEKLIIISAAIGIAIGFIQHIPPLIGRFIRRL